MSEELDAVIDRIKSTMTGLTEILADDNNEIRTKLHQMQKDLLTLFHSQVRLETAQLKQDNEIKKIKFMLRELL